MKFIFLIFSLYLYIKNYLFIKNELKEKNNKSAKITLTIISNIGLIILLYILFNFY